MENKFEEPWHNFENQSWCNKDGYLLELWKPEMRKRVNNCVNALAGVDDPKEFVRRAKENEEEVKRIRPWLSATGELMRHYENRIQKLEETLKLKNERIAKLEEMDRFYADEEIKFLKW